MRRSLATFGSLCFAVGWTPSCAVVVRLGATLGLNGEFAGPSLQCLRGLELLRDFVNDKAPDPFKLANGARITAVLDIRNDSSKSALVRHHYQAMVDSGSVDMFIGPYSPELSEEAVQIANRSGKVIMLHSAPTTSLHDKGFPFLFSVDIMASQYMADGLKALRAAWYAYSPGRQAPSMVVATGCQSTPCLFETACHGAVRRGRELGFNVTSEIVLDELAFTTNIQQVIEVNPDIFVMCGHLTSVVNAIMASRALGFSPKAMFLTQSTTAEFIEAVGTPNANYLLSPTIWDRRRNDMTCRIFGSPGAFAESFRGRFGVAPTFEAARAAAAGIALLAAVENIGHWPLTSEEARQGLLNLQLPSFYRRLTFNPSGTLSEASAFAQQAQPLSMAHKPRERYMQTDIRSVSSNAGELPLFPMPDWHEKELEIFPCEAGYLLDHTFDTNVSCIPCPAGMQRAANDLECHECGLDAYSTEPGQASCKQCLAGADCSLGHPVVPLAREGFYLMPHASGSQLHYQACDPPALCLGANRCVGENTGVLCRACKEGFTNFGWSFNADTFVCVECQDLGRNILGSLVVLSLYCAYIIGISYVALASSTDVRAITSILLKIFINYIQLTSCAAGGLGFHEQLRMIVDWSINPFGTIPGFDCLLRRLTTLRQYQAATVIGCLMVPAVLLLNYVIFTILYIRELRHISRNAHEYLNATELPDHGMAESLSSRGSNTPSGTGLALRQAQASKRMLINKSRWTIVVVFIIHPVVVRMLLEAVTCVGLRELRLRAELDVQCLSSGHILWMTLSVVGLCVFGLGIPLVTFIMLYSIKDRLMKEDERKIFGFLYNGFHYQQYYFEVLHMLLKVLLLFFATIPSSDVRVLLMFCLGLIFLGIHIRCQPYDNREYCILGHLETMSLLALLTVLTRGLVINLRTLVEESSPYVFEIMNQPMVDGLLNSACIACHGYFCLMAFWGLWRNCFVKTLQFKAQSMPDSINFLGRLLLKVDSHVNVVRYSPHTHRLDLTRLTRRERKFFLAALRDTMEWYLQSAAKFHPACVATCLRIAITRCMDERRARARQLYKITSAKTKKRGWLDQLKDMWVEVKILQSRSFKEEGSQTRVGTTGGGALRAVLEKVSEHEAGIGELQNALSQCEAEIILAKGGGLFFEIDKPPGDFTPHNPDEDPDGEELQMLTSEKVPMQRNSLKLLGDVRNNLLLIEDSKQSGADAGLPVQDNDMGRAASEFGPKSRRESLTAEALQLRAQARALEEEVAAKQKTNSKPSALESPEWFRGAPPDVPSAGAASSFDLPRCMPDSEQQQPRRGSAQDFPKRAVDKLPGSLVDVKVERTWRYVPQNGLALRIRAVPAVDGPQSGFTLQPGVTFKVSEEERGDNGVLYLRLTDGRGWVFNRKPGVGIMCERVDHEQ